MQRGHANKSRGQDGFHIRDRHIVVFFEAYNLPCIFVFFEHAQQRVIQGMARLVPLELADKAIAKEIEIAD